MSTEMTPWKPPEPDYGPKMAALTDLQRKFVLDLIEHGDDNYTRSAAAAGYSTNSSTALRVAGSRLAHHPKVLEAMAEEGDRRLHSLNLMAISQLANIARNTLHKDQLKAVGMILDRTGFHAKTEHKVTVRHETDEQKVKELRVLAKQLGLSERTILGVAGVVDAEFEEVDDFDPREGLEDLL